MADDVFIDKRDVHSDFVNLKIYLSSFLEIFLYDKMCSIFIDLSVRTRWAHTFIRFIFFKKNHRLSEEIHLLTSILANVPAPWTVIWRHWLPVSRSPELIQAGAMLSPPLPCVLRTPQIWPTLPLHPPLHFSFSCAASSYLANPPSSRAQG